MRLCSVRFDQVFSWKEREGKEERCSDPVFITRKSKCGSVGGGGGTAHNLGSWWC